MTLENFGINLTKHKDKNYTNTSTNISTVNPWTEDHNYTTSPDVNSNQTEFMGGLNLQDQRTWIPIAIVVGVGLVICIAIAFIIKKRKWFCEKMHMMGLFEVITYLHAC